MKELDPNRLAGICNAVQEGLSVLLEYSRTEGIRDWHHRYTGIQQELRLGKYEEVVAMVNTNHEISRREADRMDLLRHCLGTPPQEELERLDQGHKRYGKYYKAFRYSGNCGVSRTRCGCTPLIASLMNRSRYRNDNYCA